MPYSACSRTSTGGIDRLEAVAAEHVEPPAHERQLEQHEVALQVGEARAGDARARLHVDPARPPARGGRAAGRRTRLAHLAQRRRPRPPRSGPAGSAASERRARTRPRPPASSSRQRLDAALDLLHLGDRAGRVLARLLGRAIPCEASFWRARSASTSGSSSRRRVVERQRLVEPLVGAVAAARERRAHRLGVAPDRLEVEHAAALSGVGGARLRAGVLRDEARDRLGLLADHDVLRHRAGREAAVADRVEDLVVLLLALVEVRAVLVLALLGVSADPWVPAPLNVWQPPQRCVEDLPALVVRARSWRP